MDLDWFPFKIAKWTKSASVKEMSFAQKGLYMEMLIYQWTNGSIPSEPKRLRKIFNLTTYQYDSILVGILKNFRRTSKELLNENLFEIYNIQKEKHEKRVNAGRKGGSVSSNALSNAQASKKKKKTKKKKDSKESINKSVELETEIKTVFEYWQKVHNKQRCDMSPARVKVIEAAIGRGHNVEYLNAAILAMSFDDWDQRHKHNDIQYAIGLIKGDDKAEKWNEVGEQPKNPENKFDTRGKDYGESGIIDL